MGHGRPWWVYYWVIKCYDGKHLTSLPCYPCSARRRASSEGHDCASGDDSQILEKGLVGAAIGSVLSGTQDSA